MSKIIMVITALGLGFLGGCTENIPGHPEKVMERYIIASQNNDFVTLYELNVKTARQRKYLSKSEDGNEQAALANSLKENKAIYDLAKPTFAQGVRWTEKFYFPASSKFNVSKPFHMKPVGDDPVNSEYERTGSVSVTVYVSYMVDKDAPDYGEKKLKSASYNCTLRKIREGTNVTIYSHDDKWYLAGCVPNKPSFVYFD